MSIEDAKTWSQHLFNMWVGIFQSYAEFNDFGNQKDQKAVYTALVSSVAGLGVAMSECINTSKEDYYKEVYRAMMAMGGEFTCQ